MKLNKPIHVTRRSLIPIMAALLLILTSDAFARAPMKRPVSLRSDALAPSTSAALVIDKYQTIQTALAQDSLEGVAESAAIIAKTVRTDPANTFPLRLVEQADRLANTKDLAKARYTFARMSPHLINYVKRNHLSGFYMGYCRMQMLAWLQARSDIANPYMGKSMRCAWFRELKG